MERDTDKSKNGVERSEELQQLMQSEEEGSGGYGSTNSDAYESFSFLEMKLDDDKCTVLETTSNLTSVLTGSGLLSLPFAAYLAGWSAVLYLVVLAGIFMYSLCLIAESVETHYTRHRLSGKLNQTVTDIDYLTLGKVAFGERGEVIVSVVFGIEFFLALVSMLINIGLNINTINSKISPVSGIAIGTVLSLVLSLTNLKLAAYSSMIGLCMTLLTVIAVLLAGLELENPHAEYSVFSIEGTPLALGLIAFCFGGHATFPKMYMCMKERSRYLEVILYTGIVIILVNGFVLIAGYYYFAQYVVSPITMNIGRDIHHHNLPKGAYLRIIAAIGIVFNLQVTCPLLVFPLRDMVIKNINNISQYCGSVFIVGRVQSALLSTTIVIITGFLAVTLRGHFASVCGLVGSLATTTNSLLFPLLFYHSVHAGTIPKKKKVFHAIILMFALFSAGTGIISDYCAIFGIEGGLCSHLHTD